MDFEEEVFGVIVLIGAIVGVIGCEYLYVTNADEVRLLWIIVLIPVGAIAGALAAGLVIGIILLGVWAAAFAAVIAAIAGIIYVLHSIIVWTN